MYWIDNSIWAHGWTNPVFMDITGTTENILKTGEATCSNELMDAATGFAA